MSKPEEQAEKLMAFLQKNKEDRGMMADLRCGFSEAKEHRAWPHIARFCKLDQAWSRLPVQTVCAAFATHPDQKACGNLGATLKKMDLATIELQLRRLLACDSKEELCERLPSVIRAAKAKGVPVDYRQLYCDIYWWEGQYPPKLKWADAFWGTAGGGE